MNKRMKRLLSFVLSVCLLVSGIPARAFADEIVDEVIETEQMTDPTYSFDNDSIVIDPTENDKSETEEDPLENEDDLSENLNDPSKTDDDRTELENDSSENDANLFDDDSFRLEEVKEESDECMNDDQQLALEADPVFQGVSLYSLEESYSSNLVNGSFEEYAYCKDTTNKSQYKYANVGTITGWNTTATDQKIEVAWLSNREQYGGTSKHMNTVTVTSNQMGGADGAQFIETVCSSAGSVYHAFQVSGGESVTWKFSHRGRVKNSNDTVAMVIGPAPENLGDLDKSVTANADIFYQMVSWLQVSKGVEAPAYNEAVTYTVYTTKVDPSTHQLSVTTLSDPFSETADENHTERWEITLFSSDNQKWNTASGTYKADADQTNLVIAFAPFWSSYSDGTKEFPGINTSGNLLDAISVLGSDNEERITESSFESVSLGTSRWKQVYAANASNPNKNIGSWRTTATDRYIEVGIFDKTRNTYKLPAEYSYTNEAYVRDGCQFAELNASQESSLYQYISTPGGSKYNWSLSHRGRTGVDTFALIIGPKQIYDPKKKSEDSRDQLMQIVDWLKKQKDVVIEGDEENSCSQKLCLYTVPFNDDGGYISEDPFSWTADESHTEQWNVWIISSTNDRWYDYGVLDEDADYEYSYYVPNDSVTSIFSFVSYSSSPRTDTHEVDLSYGNLLDTISFDLYYHITADTTPNGEGAYSGADSMDSISEAQEEDFDSEHEYSGWALSDTAFRVVAKADQRDFLGAIINGTFIPYTEWSVDSDTRQYYYDVENVQQHYTIRLIFAAEKVVYDVNGGDPYHYDPEDSSTGYEVKLDGNTNTSYTSHAAQSSKDGWRFVGWQYTASDSTPYLYDAIHTISFVAGAAADDDFLKISGHLTGSSDVTTVSNISASDGVTMVAQWLYRQRYAVQELAEDGVSYKFSNQGGTILTNLNTMSVVTEDFCVRSADTEGSEEKIVVGKDNYISDDGQMITVEAYANRGYRFVGWYDAEEKLVSESPVYSYLARDRIVKTLYARFDPIGYDLSIQKEIPEKYGSITSYFAVDVHLTGLKAETSYKIDHQTTNNVTLLDGQLVNNSTYVKSDADGNASVTIYIQPGQTTVLNNIPVDAEYTVVEQDYTAYGYDSYDNVLTLTALTEDTTVVITNIPYEARVDLKKTEDAEHDYAPIEQACFDLYYRGPSDTDYGVSGSIIGFTKVNTSSLVTNTDGILTVDLSKKGEYRFVETQNTGYALENSSLATTSLRFALNSDHYSEDRAQTWHLKHTVSGVTLSSTDWNEGDGVENTRHTGSVKLLKVDDEDTDQKLGGVEFKLYLRDENDQKTGECLGTFYTSEAEDTLGELLISDLDWNKYILIETKTQSGYRLGSSIIFDINRQNADLTLPTHSYMSSETAIRNKQNVLILHKRDADGNPIEQIAERKEAYFFVYNAEDVLADGMIKTGSTSAADGTTVQGNLTIKGKLTGGKDYALVEQRAPEGYEVSEPLFFHIDENGVVSECEAKPLPTSAALTSASDTDENNYIEVRDTLIEISLLKVDRSDQTKVLTGAVYTITGRFAGMQAGTEDTEAFADRTDETDSGDGIIPITAGRLVSGETYIIHEQTAPTGYTIGADVSFTVQEDGTILLNGNPANALAVLMTEDGTVSASDGTIVGIMLMDYKDLMIDVGVSTDRQTPRAVLAILLPFVWFVLKRRKKSRWMDEQ